MSFLSRFAIVTLAGAIALSSCAVYTPTLPCTPLITQAGQGEIVASYHLASTLETSAAWSPVSHFMILGNVAYRLDENTNAKAGFGIGGYQLVGKDKAFYLGAIGGVGFATVDVKSLNGNYFIASNSGISTDYINYYGQLHAAHLGRVVSFGGALRATFVDYQNLVQDGKQIEAPTSFFWEPSLFIRIGRGPVQVQGTVGVSNPRLQSNQQWYNNREDPLAPQSQIWGVGVVIRPHLFVKH